MCQPRVLLRVRCYKHLFPQFNQFEPVSGWLNTDSIALAKSHGIRDVRFKPAIKRSHYRSIIRFNRFFFQSNLTIFSGLIIISVHTRWIKLLNNQFYKHFMPNFQHVIKLSFLLMYFDCRRIHQVFIKYSNYLKKRDTWFIIENNFFAEKHDILFTVQRRCIILIIR